MLRIVKNVNKLCWIYILISCTSLVNFWNSIPTCHNIKNCRPAKMLNQSEQKTNLFFHPQDRFLTQTEGEIHSTEVNSVKFTVVQQRTDFSFVAPIGKNVPVESCEPAARYPSAKFRGIGKIVL